MSWLGLSLFAFLAWVTVLVLPWQPWRTRERLEQPGGPTYLGEITVLIPVRDEAAVIAGTLSALLEQGDGLEIVVIDDGSVDRTAAIAGEILAEASRRYETDGAEAPAMEVIRGEPLPPGWSGKLWALEQGFTRVTRRYTLLLDADIALAPGLIPALLRELRASSASLASVMARLRCANLWERLLVPPFIFFFKLLYPFARVNDPADVTAAAAGGCMLAETAVLRRVGAFESIRGELIDDCSLARRIKDAGYGVWLGLSRLVVSHREYRTLGEFWQMVARTAFTQLGFSPGALLATTALMVAVFVVPVAVLALGDWLAAVVSVAALLAMAAAYWPVVRFYGLPLPWVLTLPVAASLLLLMTWTSAVRYWRGTRATWKNRSYDTQH